MDRGMSSRLGTFCAVCSGWAELGRESKLLTRSVILACRDGGVADEAAAARDFESDPASASWAGADFLLR